MAVRSVVRTRIIIAGDSLHLFLQDEHILRLRSDDNVHVDAVLFHPFHLRIYRGCSYASGYEQEFLILQCLNVFFHEFRSASKGACKITERVPGL